MTEELDKLLGQKLVQFGEIWLSMPNLLRNNLAIRSRGKKYIRSKPAIPISDNLKKIILDIIFHKKFDQKDYHKLTESEQKVFDDLCQYARKYDNGIAMMNTHSYKNKREMFARFEILKDTILAGNDSKEVIRQLRSILLEMRQKRYITKQQFEDLLVEIIACL
jgi:hypothetical protein